MSRTSRAGTSEGNGGVRKDKFQARWSKDATYCETGFEFLDNLAGKLLALRSAARVLIVMKVNAYTHSCMALSEASAVARGLSDWLDRQCSRANVIQ